jgi:hypothetical protein
MISIHQEEEMLRKYAKQMRKEKINLHMCSNMSEWMEWDLKIKMPFP